LDKGGHIHFPARGKAESTFFFSEPFTGTVARSSRRTIKARKNIHFPMRGEDRSGKSNKSSCEVAEAYSGDSRTNLGRLLVGAAKRRRPLEMGRHSGKGDINGEGEAATRLITKIG